MRTRSYYSTIRGALGRGFCLSAAPSLACLENLRHDTQEGVLTVTIDLHGLSLTAAEERLAAVLADAREHGEGVVRIIHGQGKHSEAFPVIKSFVRRWVEESAFARREIRAVYRGEDGSPYTLPNPGEVVVVLRGGAVEAPVLSWEDEDEREARKNAKSLRADRLRTLRRRGPR